MISTGNCMKSIFHFLVYNHVQKNCFPVFLYTYKYQYTIYETVILQITFKIINI